MKLFSEKPVMRVGLLMLLVTQCDRWAPFEQNPSARVLVLNTHFSPDSIFRISVTPDYPIYETESAVNIKNASVSVFENGLPIGEAHYVPPISFPGDQFEFRGYYVLNRMPVAGKTYRIDVLAPSFPAVSASDSIPVQQPEIVQFTIGTIDRERNTVRMLLELRDIPEPDSRFHVLIWSRLRGQPARNVLPVFREPDENNLIDTENDGFVLQAAPNSGRLFTDALFVDGTRQLIVDAEALALVQQPSRFEIAVEVRHVSQAYYRYYETAVRQLELQSDPFAEPVSVFNNVAGGLGNASGFRSTWSAWIPLQ
jgi:hypothetical protein